MKFKLALLAFFLLIVSCKSKKVEPTFVLIDSSKVEAVKKERAFDLGTRLLESCNSSRFKPFSSEEATDRVIQNATLEKISATCQKINQRNGKFNFIKLLDITYFKSTDEYIFRYKIDYEKKYFKRELSVTIDKDNKVSAISTKEIKPKPL
ncbi:hypothetical protein EQG63_06305 [Flavobacterium amnicola]|uniref:Lipoprotein n=1 Tax=Flavobacterium amnicola TaxID=2506422 RepID=A0A4Q1K2N5_9FLAO|nr:hypothetical protein [Flavobacterium amnicola]RXR19054.1 hypothetical protein EQG63_06305 [Flavobacterium amnicola]